MLTETARSTPLTSAAHAALMFPRLSPAQIARIAACGVMRPVSRGEVLIDGGQTDVPFFVLRAGEIEVIRPSGLGDLLVAVLGPAQFTGDVSMILGRPAQMRVRVSRSGNVVQLTSGQMRALIQADAEMSEVLMKALIYRRVELVAQGIGDAASEGLDALVIEAASPGGQAGSSSRIENYLGFPTGISGRDLAGRACAQALKFGADILIARGAVELARTRTDCGVRLRDGAIIPARTVIIATGARYRKPPLANLGQFEGAGVYYSATFMEAQLCDGDEVIVVGGANSAGRAAVFLARTARRVHLLVRSSNLSASMSRYLIRRIEESPTIQLRTSTEIVALEGGGHLERVQ